MDIKYLNSKIEELSEEVHNAWMKEKLSQGFHKPDDCEIYNRGIHPAKQTDEEKFKRHCSKCHPDLYTYPELPDNIKEYDRVTVRAVLSAIEKISE